MGTRLVERRRHRSWPDDLKREIVAASLEPGSSVSLVARRYDVNANQVFAWRKRYRSDRQWGQGLGAAAGAGRAGAAMIPVPSGVRVWLAVGRTDMRRGMNGLALQVQEALGRDPHAGDLYVFRGAKGDLIKIIWHDGIGMSLYAKRLEHGRFLWPSPADGTLAISAAQLAYMLDGIDWRNPRHTFRPQRAG
jgi:transposase